MLWKGALRLPSFLFFSHDMTDFDTAYDIFVHIAAKDLQFSG